MEVPAHDASAITQALLIRRWPTVRPGAGLLVGVVLTVPVGIATTELVIDSGWITTVVVGLLLALIQLPLTYTRRALGFKADGSLVIARFSVRRWIREPWASIEQTVGRQVPITIEASPPWWRKPKITIGTDVWYVGYESDTAWFNLDAEQTEFEALQQWSARRNERAVRPNLVIAS